jgi:single-stranded DNA-binding protein
MATQSKIFLIGNIGDVHGGISTIGKKPYLRLSVAVDEPGDDNTTSWYTCIIAGRKAENIESLKRVFTKGRLISVIGRPRAKGYLKADKTTVGASITILCDELPVLLDPKPKH